MENEKLVEYEENLYRRRIESRCDLEDLGDLVGKSSRKSDEQPRVMDELFPMKKHKNGGWSIGRGSLLDRGDRLGRMGSGMNALSIEERPGARSGDTPEDARMVLPESDPVTEYQRPRPLAFDQPCPFQCLNADFSSVGETIVHVRTHHSAVHVKFRCPDGRPRPC